jgi:hypothetical protein
VGDGRTQRHGYGERHDRRAAADGHERHGLHRGPIGAGRERVVHRRRSTAGACTSTTSSCPRPPPPAQPTISSFAPTRAGRDPRHDRGDESRRRDLRHLRRCERRLHPGLADRS